MKKKIASIYIETQDLSSLQEKTDNIYKSIYIISQRAKQIATTNKHAMDEELQDFMARTDKNDLHEIYEDINQISFSIHNENKRKPHLVALEEIKEEKIMLQEKI